MYKKNEMELLELKHWIFEIKINSGGWIKQQIWQSTEGKKEIREK